MEESKAWYESKTIWTSIIGVVSSMATTFFGGDIGLTAEAQAGIVTGIVSVAGVLTVIFRKGTNKTIS